MLDKLSSHESAFMFNEPLDHKIDPKIFHRVKHYFVTLNMIHIYFQLGTKFYTTDDLARAIRLMIVTKYELCVEDSEESQKK